MGRIKTQLIKRLTNQLLREHGNELKMTFEDNKPVVASYMTAGSKKIRNTIAGYVTRKMKRREEVV